MFEVIFYEMENGVRPAEEFLKESDVKMRARLVGILQILQEKGNMLRKPYSKSLSDGIFEVRGKVGSDISRVLYFFYNDGKIILTNGFVKKTQKTSKSEIALAKKYREDYMERHGEMK
jgi:phage-related protein